MVGDIELDVDMIMNVVWSEFDIMVLLFYVVWGGDGDDVLDGVWEKMWSFEFMGVFEVYVVGFMGEGICVGYLDMGYIDYVELYELINCLCMGLGWDFLKGD